jgi:cytochrome c-L
MDIKLLHRRKKSFVKLLAAATTVAVLIGASAQAAVTLRHTVTGEPLNLSKALSKERDTEGVKEFLKTGVNPYIGDPAHLAKGRELYSGNCSGCHGQTGQGGMGPSLNDGGWVYPKNGTDEGLFATIFGGARAPMTPKSGSLTLDEMLHVMAWVRNIYTGPVANVSWLTEEQKKHYVPYQATEEDQAVMAANTGGCMHSMMHSGSGHSGHGGGAGGCGHSGQSGSCDHSGQSSHSGHSGHSGSCDHSGQSANSGDAGDAGDSGDAEGCGH